VNFRPGSNSSHKGFQMAQADSNHTTKLSSSIRDPLTKSTHESITGDRGGMSSVTRRLAMNMIVTAAAASALVPCAAATALEADPIHKAIADHVAALAALNAGLNVMYAFEAELPQELRRSDVNACEEVIVETDDPRWIESARNVHALFEADEAAALGLINVNRRPTWTPPRLFTKSLKQKRNCLFPACSIGVQP